jgi:hypothetical protein
MERETREWEGVRMRLEEVMERVPTSRSVIVAVALKYKMNTKIKTKIKKHKKT